MMKSFLRKTLTKLEAYHLKFKERCSRPYNSQVFKEHLSQMGIGPGDSLFVMCSAQNVLKSSGRVLPVHLILQDLLETIGPEGTLMTLAFSQKRAQILSRDLIFRAKKTPTQNGLFSELMRRKSDSVQSLHPFHGAICVGKKAQIYCSQHHLDPYPFGEKSPYYLMAQDGGKYLGIGVGVEAFTPGHMIDDHFKQSYKHRMYKKNPVTLPILNEKEEELLVTTFVRALVPGHPAPKHHFQQLNISSSQIQGKDGILLFSMNMKEYLEAGILLYKKYQRTIWDSGLSPWVIWTQKALEKGRLTAKRIWAF